MPRHDVVIGGAGVCSWRVLHTVSEWLEWTKKQLQCVVEMQVALLDSCTVSVVWLEIPGAAEFAITHGHCAAMCYKLEILKKSFLWKNVCEWNVCISGKKY